VSEPRVREIAEQVAQAKCMFGHTYQEHLKAGGCPSFTRNSVAGDAPQIPPPPRCRHGIEAIHCVACDLPVRRTRAPQIPPPLIPAETRWTPERMILRADIAAVNRAADDAGMPIPHCPNCGLPLNADSTHRTYEEHDACRAEKGARKP
jgi:hypothetical protein